MPKSPVLALAAVALCAAAALAGTSRGNFDRAPFYDGKVPPGLGRVVHAPVVFREAFASLEPVPAKSPALAALLDSLNAELARLGRSSAVAAQLPVEKAPQVYFGARRGGTGPDGLPLSPEEIDTREPRRMAFDAEGPAKPWREALAAAGDAQAALVLELRFGDYWVRQKDWKGNKTIELGTRRAVPIPWLTSLDDPVQVLQLTGALVSREGKLLRVGAEGLIARRTGMLASSLGAQEVLREEELQSILEPGPDGIAPWRAAVGTLVAQLLEPGKAPR